MTTVALQTVVQHIRGEYLESPGLRLTAWQIQRLWNLDATGIKPEEDTPLSADDALAVRQLKESLIQGVSRTSGDFKGK